MFIVYQNPSEQASERKWGKIRKGARMKNDAKSGGGGDRPCSQLQMYMHAGETFILLLESFARNTI